MTCGSCEDLDYALEVTLDADPWTRPSRATIQKAGETYLPCATAAGHRVTVIPRDREAAEITWSVRRVVYLFETRRWRRGS